MKSSLNRAQAPGSVVDVVVDPKLVLVVVLVDARVVLLLVVVIVLVDARVVLVVLLVVVVLGIGDCQIGFWFRSLSVSTRLPAPTPA